MNKEELKKDSDKEFMNKEKEQKNLFKKDKNNKKKIIFILVLIFLLISSSFIYANNSDVPFLLQIVDKNANKSLDTIKDNYLAYRDKKADKKLIKNTTQTVSPNILFGPENYVYGSSTTVDIVKCSGIKMTKEIENRVVEYDRALTHYSKKLQEKILSEAIIKENGNEIKDGKLYKNVTMSMFQEGKFRDVYYNLGFLILYDIPEIVEADIGSFEDVTEEYYYYLYASRAKALEIMNTHMDEFKSKETRTFDLIFEAKDGKWLLTNPRDMVDTAIGGYSSENNDPAILTEGQIAIDRRADGRINIAKQYYKDALDSGLIDKNDIIKLKNPIK